MGFNRLASPDMGLIFQGETVSGLSEWQLLTRYVEQRDELAFGALVARHGPMVMGTCRRMLVEAGDAEDAFQATFLVLVRRARSLGLRDAIGPWLHGVAARVSMRARWQAARRRRVEPNGKELSTIPGAAASLDSELAAVLDQELNRLPAKYRSPVVLCYLQGLTHEEAARRLEWPLGSVKGRLARARDLLRSRLLRRGIAPAAALVCGSISREASAAVDHEMLDLTVSNCMKVTLGQVSVDAVSISIASLVKGAVSAMIVENLKWTGVATLATGLAFAGAVVIARQESKPVQNPGTGVPAALRAVAAEETAPLAAGNDSEGAKPTAPAAANAELDDLRNRLLQAVKRDWTTALQDFRANKAGLERVYQSSTRLMNAERDGGAPLAERVALVNHADRMREIARIQNANPTSAEGQLSQVRAYAAEAELWLAQASARPRAAAKSPTAPAAVAPGQRKDGGARRDGEAGSKVALGPGQDPRSRQIVAKLEEPISMSFPEETPLGDVVKYIRQATVSSDMPSGIQIYVDPSGLQEAEKTLNSTVQIDLEGVPLRRMLQLMLSQIGLAYQVVDGMLYITSSESADNGTLPPTMAAPSARMQMLGKAERGELTLEEMQDLIQLLKAQREIEQLQMYRDRSGGESAAATPASSEETKQNRQLVESLSKLTQSLIEELKELRKAPKQAETADRPPAGGTMGGMRGGMVGGGTGGGMRSVPATAGAGGSPTAAAAEAKRSLQQRRSPNARRIAPERLNGDLFSPVRDRGEVNGARVPGHHVGDGASDGMAKERLRIEAAQPAVGQSGEQAVAGPDGVDGRDPGRDRPIFLAAIDDQDRFGTIRDDSARDPATAPFVQQAGHIAIGDNRLAEMEGCLAAIELHRGWPEAPDPSEGRAVRIEKHRHSPGLR